MYAVTPSHLWVHRRLQHLHLKEPERNIPAALLSILIIATLATALAQPHWFYLKGGGCTRKFIGVQEFFFIGNFKFTSPSIVQPGGKTQSLIYYGFNEEMKDCITPSIVSSLRCIIAFCLLAILSSLMQFFLDTLGVMQKWLRPIRRNGIGSIFTVFLCVTVIGLCYYVSVMMEQQQESTKINPGTKVEIKFAISYFLVTGAGSVAIIASAANLLRRTQVNHNQDHQVLLDDSEGAETFSVGIPHLHSFSHRQEISHMQTLPPPPPYSP